MNVLLWIVQSVVAFLCVAGSVWRIANYEQVGQRIASVKALSYGMWSAIGAFEIVSALCLILPGAFKMKPILTPIAAAGLALEMLLVSGLHLHFFGWQLRSTNPATWTIGLAALAAFIAYGRVVLKPL